MSRSGSWRSRPRRHDEPTRVALEIDRRWDRLYALSLGILEIAERVSTASVETDFERGHTAVSGLWALVGLALLVVGLLRGSRAIRYGGLALFGLSLAKIFLYDLSSLSSVARAFSFILVGGLLLAGGFFLQRLSDRLGPPRASIGAGYAGLRARTIAPCIPSATACVNSTSTSVSPTAASPSRYSRLGERAGDAADVASALGAVGGREPVLGDDVGDPDAAAGAEHARRSRRAPWASRARG